MLSTNLCATFYAKLAAINDMATKSQPHQITGIRKQPKAPTQAHTATHSTRTHPHLHADKTQPLLVAIYSQPMHGKRIAPATGRHKPKSKSA